MGNLGRRTKDIMTLERIITKKSLLTTGFITLIGLFGFFIITGKIIQQKELRLQPEFLKNIYSTGDVALKKPIALAAKDRIIFVADALKSMVYVFNDQGEYQTSFKPVIPGEKSNAYPNALAVRENGELFVADIANNRILVFGNKGKYLYTFTRTIGKPLGMAWFNGELYVTDADDHKVKVFDSRGKQTRNFGGKGNLEGKFEYPNGIAINNEGHVIVADSNNKRIQIFDNQGNFLRAFGNDRLTLPKGVAIDRNGNIHVADTLGLQARIFDQEGNLLHSYRNKNKQTSFYQGLAIDHTSGQVYLTDRLNNIIEIWNILK